MSASTHPSVLKHHFDNLHQQHASERLGMWMFLATEVLFFAGLFGAYTMYRMWYPRAFEFGSAHLILWIAALNTALLITSSLTMTLAIRSARLGDRGGLYRNLLLTAALGTGFMGMKAYEYLTDFHERYVPGEIFETEFAEAQVAEATARIAHMSRPQAEEYFKNEGKHVEEWVRIRALQNHGSSPTKGEERHIQAWARDLAHRNHGMEPGAAGYIDPRHVQLFLCFYYIMTGIHGIHIIVGIGCILWLVLETYRGMIPPANYSTVEVVSLYWHLVDAIWLFLMPLLYLAGAGLHAAH